MNRSLLCACAVFNENLGCMIDEQVGQEMLTCPPPSGQVCRSVLFYIIDASVVGNGSSSDILIDIYFALTSFCVVLKNALEFNLCQMPMPNVMIRIIRL